MKNINYVTIIFLFTINPLNIFSQNVIKANIHIDKWGNMKIAENLNNTNIKDTLLFHKNISLKGNDERLIKGEIYRHFYSKYQNSDGLVDYQIKSLKPSYSFSFSMIQYFLFPLVIWD